MEKKMKKAVFIVPYFGKFNNYFQLFLNSCGRNIDFDWLFFTDDHSIYEWPENVKVQYMQFSQIKVLIQSKFDFAISLESPYKLCDFKVAYGYIFSEYIWDYSFWGHCDTDLIWGKISNFISSQDYKNFDKIGILGHCTLYRNTEYNNTIFMKKVNACLYYRDVFSKKNNFSFDEEFRGGINDIFLSENRKIKVKEDEANIYTKSSNFRITRLDLKSSNYKVEKGKKAFFVWNNGKLVRYIYNEKTIQEQEYMYIHMQSRPMHVKIPLHCKKYKIIPNAFENLENIAISPKEFSKIKTKNFNMHYFKLRFKNLEIKVKNVAKFLINFLD